MKVTSYGNKILDLLKIGSITLYYLLLYQKITLKCHIT